MKHDCSVVKDLIPLYTEGLVSSETKDFVDEHCESCEKCRSLLGAIAESSDHPEANDAKKEKIWNEIAIKERKKKTRKYVLLSFTAVLLLLASVFIYSFLIKGNTWFTQYDNTYTQKTSAQSDFGEEDIHTAAEEVRQYFHNNFGGCVLLRLSYDEAHTLDREWHAEYPQAIIFESDYYMLKVPVAGEMNRERKNWRWTVIRNDNGEWIVVGWGYG